MKILVKRIDIPYEAMKAKSLLVGIVAILLISNLDSSALGKPMFSPTPEEAAEKGQWIVIADYTGYRSASGIGYFNKCYPFIILCNVKCVTCNVGVMG